MTDHYDVPASVQIASDVSIGPHVVFAEGAPTLVQSGTTIEAACVIAAGVTIGQGALLRAGAVALSDVPPNAVVQGNPAQVVGYRQARQAPGRVNVITRDYYDFAGAEAPAKLDLQVGVSAMYLMRQVRDVRGSLSVGEVEKELPFIPKRYFLVYDVPSSKLRGEHAHRMCQQFLICVAGSCRVLLDNGDTRCEVTLDRPDVGVHMPPMIWGTQYRYSKDAVLLVFASHGYDAADYIRTYDEFLAALGKARK